MSIETNLVAPIMPGTQPMPPVMPGAVNTAAPIMPGAMVAPVMPPVQAPAPVVEQAPAPVQAPALVQAPAPVVEQAAVQAPAPVQAPVQAPVVEQAVVQAPSVVEQYDNVMEQTLMSGGLDLSAGVMAPEDEVKLNQEQKEISPIVVGGLTPLATCKTSAWGAFLKVLDFLAKDSSKDEVIMVEQGTLDTNKNGVFVHCDLKNILGDITLNITAPSYSTKLLKTIKGGEFIQILKDNETNTYVYCNIVDGRIFTKVRTKFAAGDSDSFAKAPILPEPIYQKEVSNSDKEIIKTIIEGKAAIESDEPYRFGFSKIDNSLVSIGVGKDFTHYFQDSNIGINEYKVYYPFPVPKMDSCIIKLFKTTDGATWLKTVNNVELASIICTEKIEIIDTEIEDFNF